MNDPVNQQSALLDQVLVEVYQLDDAGQYQAIPGLLAQRSNQSQLYVQVLFHLLKNYRFVAAHYLGSALQNVGFEHPLSHLSRAIGELLFNNPARRQESCAALGGLIAALPPESQRQFYADVLHPTIIGLITAAIHVNDHATILGAVDVIKAVVPPFGTLFDWSAETAAEPAVLRRLGRERAKLIEYRAPPPGARHVPYRTVVALRKLIFPKIPNSRELDIGPRFADAATRYGWPARFHPMPMLNFYDDFLAILAECRDYAADVLILDDNFIQREGMIPLRREFITELRRIRPSIKIVALYLDSWEIDPAVMREAAADVDALWVTTPSMPHWSEPGYAGKLLQAPLAHGGHHQAPDEVATERISFIGGLKGYNWHRALWWSAAIKHQLPIDWHLSSHQTDGLSPLDSYADYMKRLAASGCSLNLAMRPDLSCVITDRTFEVPLVGALLVQEAAADIDYFFVSGEHYLGFSNFAELRAIARLVAEQPDTVQEIRRAGHDFAVARYADEKLMGYLDALLFH